MLFWLFVIILVISLFFIILDFIDEFMWEIIAITMGICIIFSLCLIIGNCLSSEATIAKYNQRYESLVYQMENNLYDNDNDLGKKELYNEIREWNEDLACYQNIQDNFWLGIYYPNIYDQLEFIKYK